jgi:hypothetical protein
VISYIDSELEPSQEASTDTDRHSSRRCVVPSLRLLVVTAALAAVTGCEKKAATDSASSAATVSQSSAPAAPDGRGYTPVELCSLVTKAEAEGVLGKKLAEPKKQPGGDCWYMREGGSDFGDVEFILSIINAPVRSPQEFDTFVADQVKDMNDNLKNSGVAATPYKLERAEGVGAPAYFIDPGLYVLKGNRILAVGLGGSKGVEIAKIALARMP